MRPLHALALLGLGAGLTSCGDGAQASDEAALDPVQAIVAPSFDCSAEGLSEVETRICADPALARLDLRLDSVWSAAVQSAAATAMPEADVAEARAYQRGWIGGRNECWKAPEYASMEGVPEAEAVRQCIETQYVNRIARLQAEWALAGVLAGPSFWSCDSNPADEFVTTIFDTRPQTARVERGDQTEFMVRSRTASGTRYDGYFGRWFWSKGDSAAFVWPQTDTLLCVVRR